VIRTVVFSSCALHGTHVPVPLIAQLHHTFPKYLQAKAYGITELALETDPRFDASLASVCGTGHDSIHELIRRIMAGVKLPPHGGGGKTTKMALYAVAKYRAAGGK